MALATNLVAYYTLDETSGNASDSVGSNTLTNIGCTYSGGKINNGVNIGTKLVSTISPLTGTGDWSVSLWAKTSTSGVSQQLWTLGNSAQATNTLAGLYVYTDNKIQFYVAGANVAKTTSTVAIDGNYHHIVVTKTGDNFVVYLDGISSATGTRSSLNLGTDLHSVGYDNPNSRFPWGGQLDEVGYWSRALSTTEIASLHNSGAGLAYPFTVATFLARSNRRPNGASMRASNY